MGRSEGLGLARCAVRSVALPQLGRRQGRPRQPSTEAGAAIPSPVGRSNEKRASCATLSVRVRALASAVAIEQREAVRERRMERI